ncbi:short-chain dehydrogenase [Mucilaginibacter hurinus]|uniref:Short-chain dehydrogenase n=1 Tax=Mucilaginibacter hurinus TaxID=2201324 RepID=A0A367GRC7_9SPHI|nr:short-chain dehydrogenase [Mucilaginibacter hurinus]
MTTIITGATSGIGKATSYELAKKGHALYLLVRDVVKGDELAKQLSRQTGNREIYSVKCDLSDLYSVRTAAEKLKSRLFAVNVLINNAGGIFPQRRTSKDGFEMTFAVNHLGHFLLTQQLMPLLIKGQARIINVSSEAHRVGRPNFNDLQGKESYSAWKAYGNAKLYNIWFTKSIADKFGDKGLTAFALHPGVVNSGFGTGLSGFSRLLLSLARPFMISPEKGAETTVYLATQATLHTKSGGYFKKKKPVKPSADANNVAYREKLWQLSELLITRDL